jgi:ATP-dependent DNA helicase RecG
MLNDYIVTLEMPQESADTIDLIKKVARLERSRGFNDDAVTCGIEKFIDVNLPAASNLVCGYKNSDHFQRQRILSSLVSFLDEGGQEKAVASPANLALSVRHASGVGQRKAQLLEKLGIKTIEDLLTYLPRRLEDRSRFCQIGNLHRGEVVAVRAQVVGVDQTRVSKRTTIVRVALSDATGFLYATWFNQPWIANQIRRGEKIDLYGKIEQHYGRLQISSPVWEPTGENIEVGRIVPIYPATEGVSDRALRLLIIRNLQLYGDALSDVIPAEIRAKHGLLSRYDAVYALHFPTDEQSFEQARRSLAFEELLLLQIGMAKHTRMLPGSAHAGDGALVNTFIARLPFKLTSAQQAAMREIVADLGSKKRMMRLLQGDVGSGKTVVALISALSAIDAKYQAAIMVPTEILAQQHGVKVKQALAGLPVRVSVLTSASKNKEALKEEITNGEINLVIGTHALIEEDVSFHSLGLVIIDEQHRFGVVQRAVIEEKGRDVDLLVMSATPIPRTIALTLYGEFDVSLIDEMPLGKKETCTMCVAENRREEVYGEVEKLLQAGKKGFVVLPLVEESEKVDLKAATQVYAELSGRFEGFGVGLVHGRLSAEEKQQAMDDFRTGKISLLVATTVIEVGIDILDASFMVIEHAERFGLSQLHQLRGRIGRSGQQAICYAIATAKSEDAQQRLDAFAEYDDGFLIAEQDLLIRGPGELLGTKQHGFLSMLRAVNLLRDIDIMKKAQKAARSLLDEDTSQELLAESERRFGDVLRWLQV